MGISDGLHKNRDQIPRHHVQYYKFLELIKMV